MVKQVLVLQVIALIFIVGTIAGNWYAFRSVFRTLALEQTISDIQARRIKALEHGRAALPCTEGMTLAPGESCYQVFQLQIPPPAGSSL